MAPVSPESRPRPAERAPSSGRDAGLSQSRRRHSAQSNLTWPSSRALVSSFVWNGVRSAFPAAARPREMSSQNLPTPRASALGPVMGGGGGAGAGGSAGGAGLVAPLELFERSREVSDSLGVREQALRHPRLPARAPPPLTAACALVPLEAVGEPRGGRQEARLERHAPLLREARRHLRHLPAPRARAEPAVRGRALPGREGAGRGGGAPWQRVQQGGG